MRKRFSFFLGLFLLATIASAQIEVQYDLEGKTFYDTSRVKVKEAYEFKLRYNGTMNPRTGEVVVDPNPTEIRNGLYIMYRPNGSIDHTGNYKNNNKCGEWKFFDLKGELVRREDLGGDCEVRQ